MIRPITLDDVPALKVIIDANDLFPADMLDDMVANYFSRVASDVIWLTIDEGRLVHELRQSVAFHIRSWAKGCNALCTTFCTTLWLHIPSDIWHHTSIPNKPNVARRTTIV